MATEPLLKIRLDGSKKVSFSVNGIVKPENIELYDALVKAIKTLVTYP